MIRNDNDREGQTYNSENDFDVEDYIDNTIARKEHELEQLDSDKEDVE